MHLKMENAAAPFVVVKRRRLRQDGLESFPLSVVSWHDDDPPAAAWHKATNQHIFISGEKIRPLERTADKLTRWLILLWWVPAITLWVPLWQIQLSQ